MSVLSENNLGYDVDILIIDHDPKVVPTKGTRGSLMVHVTEGGYPTYYYKLTSLEDTECQRIVKKNKYDFVGIPTVTDDITQGYSMGSDVCNGTDFYKCCDPSVGAAVWKKIT